MARQELDPRLGDYVSLPAFAEMVSKTPRTVSRWIANHQLPVMRLGRNLYVPIPAAQDWLQQRVRKPYPTGRAWRRSRGRA